MNRILEGLGAHKKHAILVDLFCHDGWPALACLEESSRLCANVAHSDVECRFVKARKLSPTC